MVQAGRLTRRAKVDFAFVIGACVKGCGMGRRPTSMSPCRAAVEIFHILSLCQRWWPHSLYRRLNIEQNKPKAST